LIRAVKRAFRQSHLHAPKFSSQGEEDRRGGDCDNAFADEKAMPFQAVLNTTASAASRVFLARAHELIEFVGRRYTSAHPYPRSNTSLADR